MTADQRFRLDDAERIAHIGSWAWDAATDSVCVSDEWYRIFGLQPGSCTIDLGGFLRLIHPDDRQALLDAVREASRTGEPFLRRHRILDADGATRWIEGRAEVVREGGRTVRMLGTSYDVTDRRRYEESLQASLGRIVEAADAERRRVERDLHDGAQQRLVSLAMTLRLAQVRHPELRETLETASAELRLALAELRDLARGIHPAVLSEQGLATALEALAMRTPLPVRVTCPEARLPAGLEAAAYFVVAEALTNTLRHAHATRAAVSVQALPGRVLVEISDDGVGGALELRGLGDRVAAAGGQLVVDSPPGAGTRVVAELPCA